MLQQIKLYFRFYIKGEYIMKSLNDALTDITSLVDDESNEDVDSHSYVYTIDGVRYSKSFDSIFVPIAGI